MGAGHVGPEERGVIGFWLRQRDLDSQFASGLHDRTWATSQLEKQKVIHENDPEMWREYKAGNDLDFGNDTTRYYRRQRVYSRHCARIA